MMRKYQVRFGERSRETRSLRDEKVRSAPTRLSPILANVVLHELDCFMKERKNQFDSGKKRRKHTEYQRITIQIGRLRKKWDNLKGREEKKQELQGIKTKIRQLDKMRKRLPSRDPFDETYKRLFYCRFADDFIIGIIGSYADAENIRQQVRQFIQETLKLTIAEEKSHIRHSKQGVTFLGYEVRTFSADCVRKVKRKARHFLMKTISERIQLHIPAGKLRTFCDSKGYGTYETMEAIHKKAWSNLSDAEIILAYNGELRGLANYYALAMGVKVHMSKLARIWQVSLFKTLANKHKTSVQKIVNRLKTDDGYKLKVEGKKKTRIIRVFQLRYLKPPPPRDARVDIPPNTFALTLSRSELIRRHHIRKMKDVARGKHLWQQMMSARRRKTLILCVRCHQKLHAGTLPAKESLKHM
jgi:hypothetical protein